MKYIQLWLAAVLVLLALPLPLRAQSTGKIEGVITEKDSSGPLSGVQVTIEGTTLGNLTNDKGYYFILNVPPGLQSLNYNRTGYQPARVENVRLQAGQTTTVNLVMELATFELEALVFEGESEPLVPRDNVQTKQRVQSDFSESLPVNSVEEALALQAGVVQNESGKFSIRGGRLGEEAVYIDGILVRAYSEQSYLSDKISANNSPLAVGKNSVEEANVITGGFNAEYGQAQSGVINIISREGAHRLSGSAQLISDGAMPRQSDYGYNELSLDLSVPLFLPGFSSLFLSAELQGSADANPSVHGSSGGFRGIDDRFVGQLNSYLGQLGLYDPNSAAGRKVGALDANSLEPGVQQLDRFSFANPVWVDANRDGLPDKELILPGDRYSADGRTLNPGGVYSAPNPARLPGNSGDRYSINGKFTWYIAQPLKLMANFLGSRKQQVYYQHENLFNAPERRNPAEKVRTSNTILGADWNIHQSPERSTSLILRLSRYRNKQDGGALSAGSYARSTWGGFDISNLTFIDESRTALDQIYQATEGLEPQGTAYPTYNSGYLNPFASTFTPLPGQRGQDNPTNPLLLFNESGLPLRLSNDLEERTTLKADLDAQLDQHNRMKAGIELQQMKAVTRHFFYVGGPLQDIWSVEPKIYAAYVQNRLDLGDLVLDAGLRAEYFDPSADFPLIPGEALPGDPRFSAARKLKLSPRLEVGLPVTDRSQLRLSYGIFAQVPSFADYYSLIDRDIQQDLASDNINNYFGNGRLDIPYTTAFEAGFTTLLSENIYLDFVGFNKDTRGGVAYRWLTPEQLLDLGGQSQRTSTRFGKNLFIATNGDQGNVKGFDLSFSRRMTGYWSANASYSLSFARSSASDPLEFARAYGRQIIRDPVTGRDKNPDPPTLQTPIDEDQAHTLNLQSALELPADFRKDALAGKLLAGSGAAFTWHYHSGRPYTVVDRLGNIATGENNNARTRGVKVANLRLIRRLGLGNPESDRRISLFVEIKNLFNTENIKPSMINPTTGQPGVDAYLLEDLAKSLSSFTTVPVPVTVEQQAANTELSQDAEQRLALAQVQDINGNGLVEYPETFSLRLAALLAAMDNPLAYLRPREVRLGVRFDF